MLARKILPRSTKSLLRQVLTGARQHQLPVVYAPDRDQMLGNTLYNRGLPAHYEHFEAMVVIKVRALCGVVLQHCQLSSFESVSPASVPSHDSRSFAQLN